MAMSLSGANAKDYVVEKTVEAKDTAALNSNPDRVVAKDGTGDILDDLNEATKKASDFITEKTKEEGEKAKDYVVEKTIEAKDTAALKSNADFTVAKDGSGKYTTVKDAIAAAPANSKTRVIIYVKKGVYDEIVNIDKTKTNITILGDGEDSTVLTGNLNAHDGVGTFESATLAVNGDGFMAQDICIQNTAGPEKGQAVALRVSADRAVFYRCRIDAYQDTLYAHSKRQFYRDCYITGTVDFICGHGAAVFQNCRIEPRMPMKGQSNMITAQQASNTNKSAFSIQKCEIKPATDLKGNVKTFLGRPWGVLSTVVIMQSFIDDLIDPAGWAPWEDDKEPRLSTLYYGEYKNTGPGADTSKRVTWKGFKIILDPNEAEKFTVRGLIQGHLWLKSTGVPYEEGL